MFVFSFNIKRSLVYCYQNVFFFKAVVFFFEMVDFFFKRVSFEECFIFSIEFRFFFSQGFEFFIFPRGLFSFSKVFSRVRFNIMSKCVRFFISPDEFCFFKVFFPKAVVFFSMGFVFYSARGLSFPEGVDVIVFQWSCFFQNIFFEFFFDGFFFLTIFF